MSHIKPEEEPVLRAIRAVKEGKTPQERCVFCGGRIEVEGAPPGGPFSQFYFTCPCKKSSGFLRGL